MYQSAGMPPMWVDIEEGATTASSKAAVWDAPLQSIFILRVMVASSAAAFFDRWSWSVSQFDPGIEASFLLSCQQSLANHPPVRIGNLIIELCKAIFGFTSAAQVSFATYIFSRWPIGIVCMVYFVGSLKRSCVAR
jgi:hypothetical protein